MSKKANAPDRQTRNESEYGISDSMEMLDREESVLMDFLSLPVNASESVLGIFSALPDAVFRESGRYANERFVYIPGSRNDRVVLVAHADTVREGSAQPPQRIQRKDNIITAHQSVLGADDRAGCALLWLLRHTGHSLLVTDGEESGLTGSRWLREKNGDIFAELNAHTCMVQLDRRERRQFKTYAVGTDAFAEHIAQVTGYTDAGKNSCTDICVLCRDICGVNFSVGYHHEHSVNEYLDVSEWRETLVMLRTFLSGSFTRWKLE